MPRRGRQRRDGGASTVEYTLVVTGVAGMLALALIGLGEKLAGVFDCLSDQLGSSATATCSVGDGTDGDGDGAGGTGDGTGGSPTVGPTSSPPSSTPATTSSETPTTTPAATTTPTTSTTSTTSSTDAEPGTTDLTVPAEVTGSP